MAVALVMAVAVAVARNVGFIGCSATVGTLIERFSCLQYKIYNICFTRMIIKCFTFLFI